MTPGQREEVLRRIATGETQTSVAKDFKVTRAAISLLKQRTANPARFAAKYGLKKRLTEAEIATLKRTLDTSLPKDHDLDYVGHSPPKSWTMGRGYALADKLFGKQPSVRIMKECLGEHLARRADGPLAPPEPPGPRDIRRLPPELAADKSFVKYYMSPIALQIEQREYELALEHYHQQLAKQQQRETIATSESDLPPALDDEAWDDDWTAPALPAATPNIPATPPPGRRSGKHAKSKGNPFAKPKRKKNKR